VLAFGSECELRSLICWDKEPTLLVKAGEGEAFELFERGLSYGLCEDFSDLCVMDGLA